MADDDYDDIVERLTSIISQDKFKGTLNSLFLEDGIISVLSFIPVILLIILLYRNRTFYELNKLDIIGSIGGSFIPSLWRVVIYFTVCALVSTNRSSKASIFSCSMIMYLLRSVDIITESVMIVVAFRRFAIYRLRRPFSDRMFYYSIGSVLLFVVLSFNVNYVSRIYHTSALCSRFAYIPSVFTIEHYLVAIGPLISVVLLLITYHQQIQDNISSDVTLALVVPLIPSVFLRWTGLSPFSALFSESSHLFLHKLTRVFLMVYAAAKSVSLILLIQELRIGCVNLMNERIRGVQSSVIQLEVDKDDRRHLNDVIVE